jgi:ABC-type transporter Mla subunit MlaD
MKRERNAFKAGLFIIVSIALIIGVIVAIEGSDKFFEPVQHRTVKFALADNLSGLNRGDDVRVGGVKVGKITHIEYVPDDTRPEMIVHFTLPKKYVLRGGAKIMIESTVTGAADLNVVKLGRGDELPEQTALVGEAGGISALLAKANDTIDSFKATSDTANAVVTKVASNIDPMVGKYDTLADRSTEMMVALRDMIGQSTLDFKGTMKNLNDSTKDIKERLPAVLDGARNALTKLQGTIDSATIAMEDIKTSAANTKDVTASARGILMGNRAKFDGIIAGLKASSDNVKNATAELRRSPWRLLYKPNPGELDNLVLFDAARQFSDGANNLNDAVQALRDAVNSGDLTDEQMRKKIELLDHAFDQFHGVEQKLWKDVKK